MRAGLRFFRFRIAILFVLALLSGCSRAGDERRFSELEAWLAAYRQDAGLPSLSVAVAMDGQLAWQAAFGLADPASGRAAGDETLYRLSSLSKLYTASLALALGERGVLDLEAPLSETLGDLQPSGSDWSALTPRSLLQESAGLLPYWQRLYVGVAPALPSLEDIVRRYAIPLQPLVGSSLASDLNYAALQVLLERCTGQPYQDMLLSELLQPLGLAHTTLLDDPWDAGDLAVEHLRGGQPLPFYNSAVPSADAVFASASDVARFGLFQLGQLDPQEELLSQEGRLGMRQESKSGGVYRPPWVVEEWYGYQIAWTGGWQAGTRALLVLVPDKGIAVAVLGNSEDTDGILIAQQALSSLLPRFRLLYSLRQMDIDRPSGAGDELDSVLQKLEGTWLGTAHDGGYQLPVTLRVEPTGRLRLELEGAGSAGEAGAYAFGTPRIQEGWLQAHFPLVLPPPELQELPHSLWLELYLQGEDLSGYLLARSPGIEFGLPFVLELEKAR